MAASRWSLLLGLPGASSTTGWGTWSIGQRVLFGLEIDVWTSQSFSLRLHHHGIETLDGAMLNCPGTSLKGSGIPARIVCIKARIKNPVPRQFSAIHSQPGNGGDFYRTRLKNLLQGLGCKDKMSSNTRVMWDDF